MNITFSSQGDEVVGDISEPVGRPEVSQARRRE